MRATTLSLHWQLRRSLLDYVESSGGVITCADGVTRSRGGFKFPSSETPTARAAGLPAPFSGTVDFAAYGGMLRFTIHAPTIEFDEDGLVMSVLSRAEDDERIVLARLEDVMMTAANFEDSRQVRGTPVLTAQGSTFFDGFYPVGTPLEPLLIEREVVMR